MPLQNRVLPTGEIIAQTARGSFMGNRGILHDDQQRLGKSRWKHKAWIICLLDFKNRHRDVMTPNTYTELFFHDEAVALCAGHRPCAECQRQRFTLFCDHWEKAFGKRVKAGEMDNILHPARVISHSRKQVTTLLPIEDTPNGAFISLEGKPTLRWGNKLHPWSFDGYANGVNIAANKTVEMLTPMPIAKILASGFKPELARL